MPLLDQYGRIQKQGQGGGYRLVSDDGFGKRVYEDYDPVTGIKSIMVRDHDGSITTKRYQNVDALGAVGKVIKDAWQPHRNRAGGFEQQAVIPTITYYEIMQRCGWKPGTDISQFDQKKFDRIVNDDNEGVIKSRPGRISCQQTKWY